MSSSFDKTSTEGAIGDDSALVVSERATKVEKHDAVAEIWPEVMVVPLPTVDHEVEMWRPFLISNLHDIAELDGSRIVAVDTTNQLLMDILVMSAPIVKVKLVKLLHFPHAEYDMAFMGTFAALPAESYDTLLASYVKQERATNVTQTARDQSHILKQDRDAGATQKPAKRPRELTSPVTKRFDDFVVSRDGSRSEHVRDMGSNRDDQKLAAIGTSSDEVE